MQGSFGRTGALSALLLAASACGVAGSEGSGTPGSSSSSSGSGSSSGAASSSSGSSSGGSSSGGSGSGGSSGSSGSGQSCAGTSSKAERMPLDLYVMLDQSGSMAGTTASSSKSRWEAVTSALLSFVEQPGLDGTSIGLQYFPLESLFFDSCSAEDYAKPDVEIGPIAQTAPQLRESISRHAPSTNTPTSAALQGAVDHARAWASDHEKHAVAVVLATDGEPTECDTDLDHIDAIAAAGLAASPSVRTFVIGVGDLKDNLDGIARAGGTTAAFIVQTSGDVDAQFLEALNAIRGSAVGCSYVIPAAPDGRKLDYGQVSVRYTPGGGAPVTFALARDASGCGTRDDAWRYDDPAAPRQIVLCPAACKRVEADGAGRMDVVLGCRAPIAQ